MSNKAHGKLLPVGGGDPIPLIREVLTMGRRDSCDIPLRFPNVSNLHCKLMYRDGYWYIRDEGSTNGIKVNGQKVTEKYLHPGDEITIAKKKWTIDYQLQGGRPARDVEEEDEVMGTSLLEKAGLAKPKANQRQTNARNFDPGEFLIDGNDA